MDEASLEESLKTYKEQLDQISLVLQTADELTKLELYDLEKDLKELISVTEDSLFSLKKGRLLSLLTETNDCAEGSSSSLDSRPTQTCGETSATVEEHDEKEEEDDFVGTKCRVKYTQEWGSFQYHNAMVLGVEFPEAEETEDGPGDGERVKVRVLFLNPIHKSMVPCKFFLDGKCNYTQDDCRYSHGYLVDVDELQEYQEPDFTKLSVGGDCLAKYDENGVWYQATVSELHEETVTVSFYTYKDTLTLDFHSVLPIAPLDHDSSESSCSEDEQDDVINSEGIAQLSYKPSSMQGPLGEWEEHTKGIGSKLMAKMGYVFGRGLGKDSQGKIEPVEIRLLPPGKSLDKIMELREKGLVKDPTKKKKSVKQIVAAEMKARMQKEKEHAAFDLINHLSKKPQGGGNHNSTRVNTSFSIEDTYKSLKNNQKEKLSQNKKSNTTNKSNINIQVFQNSEKISALRKKLAKQKDALSRNPGDSSVSRTIKLNIAATERELDDLTTIERALQSKVHMKNQSKKLSFF